MKNRTRKNVVITLIAVSIASCKKDKDNPSNTNTNEPILATWTFVSHASDKPSGFIYHEKIPTLLSEYESACAQSSTVKFEKGSSATTGNLAVFDNCKKSNNTDTWTLQNNVLTMETINYQVLQLDNTTLRVSYDGGEYGTNGTTGFIKQGQITDTFTFKR